MNEANTILAAQLYAESKGLKFSTDDLPCVTIRKGRSDLCFVTAHPVTFVPMVRMSRDYTKDEATEGVTPQGIKAEILAIAQG